MTFTRVTNTVCFELEAKLTAAEKTILKVHAVDEIRSTERARILLAIKQIWIDRPDASDQYNVGFGEALTAVCATIRAMN